MQVSHRNRADITWVQALRLERGQAGGAAVDSRGAQVTVIHYVPIWVRPQDFVVLPAGTAWRTDHTDAAALRASYRRTVAVVWRTARIEPIPAHLP